MRAATACAALACVAACDSYLEDEFFGSPYVLEMDASFDSAAAGAGGAIDAGPDASTGGAGAGTAGIGGSTAGTGASAGAGATAGAGGAGGSGVDAAPDGAGGSGGAPTPCAGGEALPSSGIEIHLDAEAIGAGGFVTTWPDSGPNGLDVTNPNPAQQPLLIAAAIGGRPAVRFDGADDHLSTTANVSFVDDAPFTLLVVMVSPSPSGVPVYAVWGAPGQARAGGVLQGFNGSLVFATGFGFDAVTPADAFAPYAMRPALVTMIKDAGPIASTIISFNHVDQLVTGPSNGTAFVAERFQVGAWNGTQAAAADLAEIVLYARALDATDRFAAECYLAGRYGITP